MCAMLADQIQSDLFMDEVKKLSQQASKCPEAFRVTEPNACQHSGQIDEKAIKRVLGAQGHTTL